MKEKQKEISYQNYDIVFKYATQILQGKMLDFLGLHTAPIAEVVPTELPYIEARRINEDYIFRLQDDTLLHLEYQSTLALDDIVRFMIYDARLYEQYKKPIKTAVIIWGDLNTSDIGEINAGSITYRADIIKVEIENPELVLEEENTKIQKNEEPDIAKIVFLPVMCGKNKVKDITLKTIETIKKMKNRQSEIDQLIATVIILADKLLDEQTIEKLWEEFKMLNVFKYAEERGKKEGFQEGIEEGIEKGIEKGMVETIIKQLCKKLGDLPQEYKERIIGQDKATLEMLAENIFDIFSLNDLDRFLKN
jgi:hypothetical protein